MIEQNQLNESLNLLSESLKAATIKIGEVCKELSKTLEKIDFDEVFKILEALEKLFKEIEFDEVSVLSEKEIKKKIKYAKTPMEAKHWNKMLNEKKRRKTK